ncbi:AzlD domain-containing protein [Weissella bombi]|uniref:Branched-chain amino acid transport protein n=1 Tax=Weissella bombi TaxID=1505725 RepID=A0A1C3YY91_9LACO|nr:AzlD domain-containing protein [Weissella bombi]SCB75045.1 Branched-chain amino acid transport protein [Weissella bombi]
MPSNKFIIITIIGCGIVTWLSRILPLVILKHINLSKKVVEFLNFVPIAIMASLWFESLFIQHIGHLPSINYPNLLASIPTVLSAILTKNLLVIVFVGVLTLSLINILM